MYVGGDFSRIGVFVPHFYCFAPTGVVDHFVWCTQICTVYNRCYLGSEMP